MTESERYDYAREEVVCDSMQTVLNDGVAFQEMANREPTVFGKLKQFITELIGRIRRAMKGIPGYTKEAREFAGIAGNMEKIERAFAEAAEEAGRKSNAEVGIETKYSYTYSELISKKDMAVEIVPETTQEEVAEYDKDKEMFWKVMMAIHDANLLLGHSGLPVPFGKLLLPFFKAVLLVPIVPTHGCSFPLGGA